MWFSQGSQGSRTFASFGGPRIYMCMYMHRGRLVYTNILTAGFGSFGSFGNFASLGGPRLLGGGVAHGMRTGAD